MATINNSELINEVVKTAMIEQAVDKVPTQLAEKVVPTMESNPQFFQKVKILATLDRSTTTGASPGNSFYTASATKKTYITNVVLSNMSDVVADNTRISIRCTSNGTNGYLVSLSKLTTTAYAESVNVSFTTPLLIDKGSLLYFLNVFTAGVSVSYMTVYGYEEVEHQ